MEDCVIPAGSVAECNAHLIAAAPELLAALRVAADEFEGSARDVKNPVWKHWAASCAKDARAAIAKAQGADDRYTITDKGREMLAGGK